MEGAQYQNNPTHHKITSMPRIPKKIQVIVIWLLVFMPSTITSQEWSNPAHYTELDPRTGGYLSYSRDFDTGVDYFRRCRMMYHTVLDEQHLGEKPLAWHFSNLIGQSGDSTRLAFRSDNLYLVGFRNKQDKWYTFKDEDHLIPGSTPLGFRGNYASLGPQETGWKNLVGVQVGRKALMEAADILSNYDPDVTKEEDLKVALLRVLVMIPEAQRFFAIRKLVYNSWENGGVIDEATAKLVVNWRRVCCALLIWNKTGRGRWDSEEAIELRRIGVRDPTQALNTVDTMLLPNRCSVMGYLEYLPRNTNI